MKKSIISIISIFAALNSFGANFDQFLNAIAKVESNNNPKAFNSKENAIGKYQIRYKYFIDSKRFDNSLSKYSHIDCYNPEIGKKVVAAYLKGYESISISKGDWQALAKTHNAGPNWRNKTGQAKENLRLYWRKIKANLS